MSIRYVFLNFNKNACKKFTVTGQTAGILTISYLTGNWNWKHLPNLQTPSEWYMPGNWKNFHSNKRAIFCYLTGNWKIGNNWQIYKPPLNDIRLVTGWIFTVIGGQFSAIWLVTEKSETIAKFQECNFLSRNWLYSHSEVLSRLCFGQRCIK